MPTNKDTINEFIMFCTKTPDRHLWASLIAFMQEKYDNQFTALLVEKNGELYDTKNWDGQDSPMVLFKDKR